MTLTKGSMRLTLGVYERAIQQRLNEWEAQNLAGRIWQRDATVWTAQTPPPPELLDRLGWLDLPVEMRAHVDEWRTFAEEIHAEGFTHAVLLGMGGSSLAPEVFQQTFGNRNGYPELLVLDSTHPDAVRAIENQIDLTRTLFIVSSKSGTTIETISFFRYFWHLMREATDTPGSRFIAITDPGTPLEELAHARHFRRVFNAPPDVGGRYSALSPFGLVPAALIGADVAHWLQLAGDMADACRLPASQNPGLVLAAAIGEMVRAGRDKLTFITAPEVAAFPAWLEQLIAESLGKEGKGVVPVVGEVLGEPGDYSNDRIFVVFSIGETLTPDREARLAALEKAGHPIIRLMLPNAEAIIPEMFAWEFATAALGALLGVHPFNQPDVQLAKDLARRAMKNAADPQDDDALSIENIDTVIEALRDVVESVAPGDYIALQAFLPPLPDIEASLQALRLEARSLLRVATTLGFGPRFLHSTGQLHKGGPKTAICLQLVDAPMVDLLVPETDYTFAQLIAAQARGDAEALRQRGQRIVRINLGHDVQNGLTALAGALNEAML
ncbi:transaldolase / glucose-6-phosphate isomerase [Ardenticatena maritima]|uniref:Glucose-6-phosphate isomerase n=1 Tax=Ardenticatena maritima TaxID=872965 RepID=A0A0M8K9H1_9CHLR|nr:hypothetical protein [Ardenticatena maritima]KPL87089.1 hypothetical protein SE16_11035 [Ardenticatena maritima]GAP63591.1 transaldolase / glucose-6-phosphate isomerase [Ardenticatena maritima]